MKNLFHCFRKEKKPKIKEITLNDIKKQQEELLDLVSEERFQEKLIEKIHRDIEKVIEKESIHLKKRLEAKLEKDIVDMEYKIISMISMAASNSIEKKVESTVENLKDTLNNIGNELIEQYKNELELESKTKSEMYSELVQNRLNRYNSNYVQTNLTALTDDLNETSSIHSIVLEALDTSSKTSLSSSTIGDRYKVQYNEQDNLFWGLGIENETYLQGTPVMLKGSEIVNRLGRERYSVDYTKNYVIEEIKKIMRSVYNSDKKYEISRMINAHSFLKTDKNGEHKTTYEKVPKSNSKYLGKSVIEEWFEFDEEVKNAIDPEVKNKTNIFFDGDTIEFITENFYKTNSKCCVDELVNRREWFLKKLNYFIKEKEIWKEMGELHLVEKHPGLNIFQSAPNKIVLFNNSTLHFHITLPTKLKNKKIENEEEFVEVHKRAMKMIQWFEPFFISTLGAPDIFQFVFEKANNREEIYFSSGSMRNTLSRYIGIGTYDLDEMPVGKIINKKIDEVRPNNSNEGIWCSTIQTQPNFVWWRDLVKEKMLYKLPEEEIGLDFNFRKHYQSGLEFRVLDGIPMSILKDVIDILLLLCEHSYSLDPPKASSSDVWNRVVYNSMSQGYKATINKSDAFYISKLLRIPILIEQEMTLEEFYYRLLESMLEIYSHTNKTKVLQYMTAEFIKINRWENFNKVQCLEHLKTLEGV